MYLYTVQNLGKIQLKSKSAQTLDTKAEQYDNIIIASIYVFYASHHVCFWKRIVTATLS